MEMNKSMNVHELNDETLNEVSGGAVLRPSDTNHVDYNQSGCLIGYRCKVCGGKRGKHTATCTVELPDCCGSCRRTGFDESGLLICTDTALDGFNKREK